MSQYQKGKTKLDFTEARDSEWQWHQLGHMQVCTLFQTDNHTSTSPLSFFTGRMPFLPPNQQCQSTEGTRVCDHSRAAVGTEFLSPYSPHTHTHRDPHGDHHTHGRPGSLVLRFSNTNLSLVSRASFGAGSFSAAAPTTWNSLPPSLRTCTSPDTFRRHLNTDYFQHAFQTT